MRSEDFKAFVRSLHKIVLHISLSDPPIQVDLVSIEERLKKEKSTEQYDYHSFRKSDFYCVDGFPKEDLPCVVLYPAPMRGNYVYQGIKPAVVTLSKVNEEVRLFIEERKERAKEKKARKEEAAQAMAPPEKPLTGSKEGQPVRSSSSPPSSSIEPKEEDAKVADERNGRSSTKDTEGNENIPTEGTVEKKQPFFLQNERPRDVQPTEPIRAGTPDEP